MSAAVTTNNTDNLGSGPSSVSRSGRVRKKSSLLADYESTDGFDKPRKKYEKDKTPKSKEKSAGTPKVTLKLGPTADTPKPPGKRGPKGKRLKLSPMDLQQVRPDNFMMDDDEGELEIDLPAEYENSIPILGAEEIIDEELLDEEDGATEVAENTSVNRLKSQAESTYFMEKSLEKKCKTLTTTPGQPPGKVKQARKDKGSSRVTAYMLWSKEQRENYEKKNTGLDLPQISKKLSDLWATVPPNQKMMWKNKAAKIMKKNSNLNENMKNSGPKGPKGKSLQKISPHSLQHLPPPKPVQHPKQSPGMKKSYPSPKKSPPAGPGANTNRKLSPGGKGGKTNKNPINRQQPGKSKVTTNLSQSQGSPKKVSPPRGKGKANAKKNSNLQNNFNLVGSSEFSQQTNVQINGDTRKMQKNSSNSVSLANMSQSSKFAGSSHSKTAAHHYSPKKEEDPAMYKVTGTAPIDVAAHFSLLGESLSIIGERLKEHEGQTVSGSLSVLLDSLLCACGPLLCLTQQVPELNSIPPEKLAHILDNIAYIMPGL